MRLLLYLLRTTQVEISNLMMALAIVLNTVQNRMHETDGRTK